MRVTKKIVVLCLVVSAIGWVPRAMRFHGHTEGGHWAVVSPDANYLASGSSDRTVRIWEVATQKQLAILAKAEKQIMSVVFSPDSKVLASADKDGAVTLWNVADGKQRCRLEGSKSSVHSVAFSPDSTILVSCAEDKIVKAWELSTGKELFVLRLGYDFISTVAYSPDGKLFACAGWVGSGSEIQMRDAKTGKELRSLKKPNWRVSDMLFSPDSEKLCATSDFDRCSLALFDVASGKERSCDCPKWLQDDDGWITSLAFSPDSRTLAIGQLDAIGLWDVSSGKNTSTFTKYGEYPYLGFIDRFVLDPRERRPPELIAATFKTNGDLLLVGTRFETLALWRVTTVPQKNNR
jgi:WD40 repeat protein